MAATFSRGVCQEVRSSSSNLSPTTRLQVVIPSLVVMMRPGRTSELPPPRPAKEARRTSEGTRHGNRRGLSSKNH